MSEQAAVRPTVGFVGLGRMGLPMARRIAAAGFPLIVFNRTRERAAPVLGLGASEAGSPGELAARSDMVLTCLDSEAASEQVLLGGDGVVARARAGALLADHATIGPALALRIAAMAAEHGLGFLDAPVSGGPEGAEQGTLTIMAGGSEADFVRAEPVFQSYGRTVVRMGEVGAGSNTKLINQLLTFVHGTAAAEALVLGERLGLTPAALAAVLRVSFGQSRMLERTVERVEQGNFAAGAALRLYAKDLKLIETTAAAAGAGVPITRAVQAVLERALERGMGDRDLAALYQLYREER